MFVVRTDVTRHSQSTSLTPKEVLTSLVLQSLDSPDSMVRFETFASESSARLVGAEVYQLLFQIHGVWTAAPTHAVYAIWHVANPQHEEAFIESRRQLFHIRQKALSSFAYDWLLKRLDEIGYYMVLGLYGDEAGARRLCREHPDIQHFIQAQPASAYVAADVTGLRCFRVEWHTPT